MTTTHIGHPAPLIDGQIRVRGQLRYTGDLALPQMLHARLVTSPYPHAEINAIDRAAALALPGVVAVLTAAEMPTLPATSRHRLLLARGRVRFVGQPVALVLAETEAEAEDGAEAVHVDYSALPAATTLAAATAPNAPLVWPGGTPGGSDEAAAHGAAVAEDESDGQAPPSNVSRRVHFGRGDVAQGFAAADAVVERRYTTSMVHQSYLEPHVTLAQPEPTGGMALWTSTQAAFYVQQEVADVLGLPESEVRLTAMPVGGAFGAKFVLYQPLVALAARQMNRPVRLLLTRSEEMQAALPAPRFEMTVRVGATRDGRLTALEASLDVDNGCYPDSPVGIAALLLGSLYQCENLAVRGREILTHKPSSGAYRAPGAPQAFFALESALDELAGQLDLDPLDFRLQNASRSGEPMANGKPWPGIGLHETIAALQAHPAWQQRDLARQAGRGVGVAVGGWPGGTEPAAALCMLQRDGTLHLNVGSVDLTGTDTTLAALAAEQFGLSPDRVRLIKGDTLSSPFTGMTGGSKITFTVGPAVMAAAADARQQLLKIAAEMLEAAAEDLELVDGEVRVRGLPDRTLALDKIARQTMRFGGRYAPVTGRGRHANPTAAPGFSAQLAEVLVDEATGHVTVTRLVVVQDVGKALNPLLVAGQMMGGGVQGIGWGLHEALRYDDEGQLLTGSLMDYTLPKIDQAAAQLETVMVEVPSEKGPHGARGVGEPPVIPTAAAIANAIADATGKRCRSLPITPQTLWKTVRD